ncbi:hypothetical protein FRB96_005598 [Tulasnella sp. 330]|nr:hypothetical protein FRB96_005598 [Tulasnella sp. 330]KAG8890773.1 hypothetical protein FRB98_004818 [Tulasnella sp. 332]
MTPVSIDVPMHLDSIDSIPSPAPSSGTAKENCTAEDTAEQPNRLGGKGPLDHFDYKTIRIERKGEADPNNNGFPWYHNRKHGFKTPEGLIVGYRWSLHLSDWFYIQTDCLTVILVGRSILHELGLIDDEIPPVTNKEDLEESEGLGKKPMRIEDLHYSPHDCYWPRSAENAYVIPKLDRTLGADGQLKPDILIVHDPDNITQFARGRAEKKTDGGPDEQSDTFKIKYVRRDPSTIGIPWVPLAQEINSSYVAHLHLSKDRKIGSGNHSRIWQAHFDLPYIIAHDLFYMCCKCPSSPEPSKDSTSKHPFTFTPPTMRKDIFRGSDSIASPPEDRPNGIPTRFSVAAKMAGKRQEEMPHLINEAKTYHNFPQYLSCDWSGYQQVPPVHVPQPCCAVVPKSYGFWVPEVTYSKLSNGVEVKKNDVSRLSPILLLEECGDPINVEVLTLDQRRLFLSMIDRMQKAGFTQGSIFTRNILMQPGPLRFAPELRTMDKPSFRFIDFGRAIRRRDVSDAPTFTKASGDDIRAIEALLGFNQPMMY